MPPVYPPIPRPHLTYKEVDKLDNPVSGTRDDEDDDPLDPNVCKDEDNDTCDDCALTGDDQSGGDMAGDGLDKPGLD